MADGVGKCYLNSGQTCSALTRCWCRAPGLPKQRPLPPPLPPDSPPATLLTTIPGSAPWYPRRSGRGCAAISRKGIAEGAKLVTGGAEPPEGLERGYFVRPTVFSEVRNDMTIAREEIFGPVLAIIPYDDEEDAIRIANDTVYGLAAAVWSGDPERAKRVARRIRTGQVEINGGKFNPLAPFGGYKQSGNGREYGHFGIEEFLEVKALLL